MLKYKCLVLDHDDTAVKSTAQVHYPSFKKTISAIKPWLDIGEKEFLLNCFDPGFYEYMEKTLGFTESEMKYQLERWLEHIRTVIPEAYEGIKEVIVRQKSEGGIVCVVSHSYPEVIRRDYSARFGLQPDAIYGGDEPPERRKPSVFPLFDIMRRYNLKKEDVVVVDDLKPGLDMAKQAGVDFICAGWSHTVKEISDYMRAECPVYLEDPSMLSSALFGD
ncbi:MAG: HAD hydrolase-like protein [Clostridia bacterium]|nr:HAD hydrolase-like protein [Clostridia bacterium]